MTVTSIAPGQPGRTVARVRPPARSFWRTAWVRFSRNHVAMVSALFLLMMFVVAAFATSVAPQDPNRVMILNQHLSPSGEHLLGTDESGRDVFSRLIVGARASIAVGLTAMIISIVIGSLVGSVAGFFGGFVDTILMRITDGMMAIPYFFLVLIVVAVFGSSFTNIVIVIGVTSWMVVARIVRSDVLRFRANEFVTAARSIGAGDGRLLVRHILPHAVPSILVAATLGVANAILLESALSFLGLGIQPPAASWGNMLSNSQAYIWDNPLLPLYPGLLILLTVLAFNFLGDALRDALDPQYREGGH
ncbi:MAG: Dipeptide transport system permease protein DppC [uncultured Thermomicrobiales bacterium]|uniref:Dipeptide transport system permease protein DppC n=1 Tax=uncultured Thermomicrobiales bacterium TaxID=1645740 RepID=A0A6J4UIE1_9BACT|nr:MAG: Dipeptide transport system permease protein DppC [uncultured Thermomicrobiales bacterium]